MTVIEDTGTRTPPSERVSPNVEAVAAALGALGAAYRGDWSVVDGRTTRDELGTLAALLDPDATPHTYEQICVALGVCPAERCWFEWCSTSDRGLCAHAREVS